MKKTLLMVCLAISWLFLSGFTTYTQTGPVNVIWDAVTTDESGNPTVIDHYEVKLIREVTLEEHNYGTITNTIRIPKPRSGKWELRVRAVKLAQDGTLILSDWCSSLNVRIDKSGKVVPCSPCTCAKLKDGTNGAWKVFWKPGGVIGPIIIIPKQVTK